VSGHSGLHSKIRPEWLASRAEEPLEPGQPIIDAHHHLYDRSGTRYLLDEFAADICSGHNVRATVLVQARAMYRADGPEELKPVGETEFANAVAEQCASGGYGNLQVCAGIVGFADLTLGVAVRQVLEAHIAAGGGRFRGIRQGAAWDPDPVLLNPAYAVRDDMLDKQDFRAGFALLAEYGLSFDAWLFFHQIPRLTALARAFPGTPIVLDHCGGILGLRGYAGRRDEVFRQWKTALLELAACPNVTVKLGGLGMKMCGFGFEAGERAPSSVELAEAWRPWIETVVAAFGSGRCMVESNFPVDKGGYSYAVLWNAMKRLFAGASDGERADVFWRTAARFYRLQIEGLS
jgi:L-fuconolactonase